MSRKKNDNSKATPPETTAPVTPAPETPAAHRKIDAVAETLKNNKGLAAMFLRKSPLGLLAGAVLATKEGQELADKVIDKAAKAAGSAFESASTLAHKAEAVIRETPADKLPGKIVDAIRPGKKDGDNGPKGP